MAMQSGTATDYLDLFRKFRAFVLDKASGAGWDPMPGNLPQTDCEGFRAVTGSFGGNNWRMFDPPYETYVNFYEYHELDMEFFESKTIGSIRLTMPDLSGGALIDSSPRDIALYTSTDGVAWSLAAEWVDEEKWMDSESRTFTLPAPVSTVYLRLKIPDSNYSNYSRFYKLRLFDGSGVELPVNIGGERQCFRLMAQSPRVVEGLSAHVNIVGACDPAAPYFSIGVQGATLIEDRTMPDSDIPYATFHYESPFSYAHFWDSTMPYRFYGDDVSVSMFVRVGSTDRQLGFGTMLAYGTPQQYPFPMYIGAEHWYYNVKYDYDLGGDIRGFTNPGRGSLYAFTPELVWREFRNYYTSSGNDSLSPGGARAWPGCTSQYTGMRNAPGTNDTNGNHILYPIILLEEDKDSNKGSILGEIPNLYLVPSLGLSTEDIVTVSGQDYRVYRNIWRQSAYDFCAVKEV